MQKATTRLRELFRAGRSLVLPGCYNALSAKVLAEAGFPALYMTGYGTSLSLLGLPDAGLATMTEMHLTTTRLACRRGSACPTCRSSGSPSPSCRVWPCGRR
jgi:2-methylisocitrate lyase-like PEP mutase family enzyme